MASRAPSRRWFMMKLLWFDRQQQLERGDMLFGRRPSFNSHYPAAGAELLYMLVARGVGSVEGPGACLQAFETTAAAHGHVE